MLAKIVSGGQTGADRAALDAALERGFPAGGFCPKNRMAEDGPVHERYPLIETDGGYLHRTQLNARFSDGTLIFFESELTGGTRQTWLACEREGKPSLLIDISETDWQAAVEASVRFVEENGIQELNVAGPRASGSPAMYGYVKRVVETMLRQQFPGGRET